MVETVMDILCQDQVIYSELVKADLSIPVQVIAKDLEVPMVNLPCGLLCVNSFRNVIENIVRNVAKHSSPELREYLQHHERVLELILKVSKRSAANDREPDEIWFSVRHKDLGRTSFDHLKKILKREGFLLVDDQLRRGTDRHGILEIVLAAAFVNSIGTDRLSGSRAIKTVIEKDDIKFLVDGQFIGRITFEPNGERLVFELRLRRAFLCAFETEASKRAIMRVASNLWEDAGLETNKPSDDSPIYIISDNEEHDSQFLCCSKRINTNRLVFYSPALWPYVPGNAKQFCDYQYVFSRHLPWKLVIVGKSGLNGAIGGQIEIECVSSLPAEQVPGILYLLHDQEAPTNPDLGTDRWSRTGFVGYKPLSPIRPAVEDALNGDPEAAWDLLELLEPMGWQILIIDERSEPSVLSDSMPRDVMAGVKGSYSVREGWLFQGVDIVPIPPRTEDVSKKWSLEESTRWPLESYDIILVHDGFLRRAAMKHNRERLESIFGDRLKRTAVVHSDGSSFQSVEELGGDLLCQRWSDLEAILRRGSKQELLAQIRSAGPAKTHKH